ncbi:MAG: phage holin family protein [Erysipelotrichaceae bacterium]
MDAYLEYIHSELFILIPVLYLIGVALKKTKFKDELIPLTLGAISIVLCGLYILGSCDIDNCPSILGMCFTIITQGVLIAGASVYANQLFKQLNK